MLSIIKLRIMRLRDDYMVIVIMTLMALGLTFVFGLSYFSDYKPEILVIDNDAGRYSNDFINELKRDDTFKFNVENYDYSLKQVEEGKSLAAIIIAEDFSKEIEKGNKPSLEIMKMKDSIEAFTLNNTLSSKLNKMINNITIAKKTANYISPKDSAEKVQIYNKAYNLAIENWKYKKPIDVKKESINTSNMNEFDNAKHSIIGFSLFFSMFTIVFSIGEILNERKYNTWQRQKVSPISRVGMLGGNLIVTFIIGVIQVLILILAGKYLFNIDWGSSMLGISIIVLSFVFTVTCLGLFLSGIVKTSSQLSAITPIVLVSTAMLGGAMWPLFIVKSKILLALANLTPQKWAIEGMEKIAMYGQGFEAAIMPSIILVGMGIIYFIAGVKLVKFE